MPRFVGRATNRLEKRVSETLQPVSKNLTGRKDPGSATTDFSVVEIELNDASGFLQKDNLQTGWACQHPMSLSWDYPSRVVDERCRALNGVCEPVKQSFSVLESKTCIGDALTVRYGCILTARDKMALDHQRSNR